MTKYLMVAEKPSLANKISRALGGPSVENLRKGKGKCPLYKFSRGRSSYIVTSVFGHVFDIDFMNSSVKDPFDLFETQVVRKEIDYEVVMNLREAAVGCDSVLLWLDYDNEGENICYEVFGIVYDLIKRKNSIKRVKFSSFEYKSLREAFRKNRVSLDLDRSLSVDARRYLDLVIGVSFSRLLSKKLKTKNPEFRNKRITYGPCQTPTLGFCVKRYEEVKNNEQPYYLINLVTEDGKVFVSTKKFNDYEEAKAVFNEVCSCENEMKLLKEKEKETTVEKPQKGMKTTTLMKLGSERLGLSPEKTMNYAQALYSSGYITYPRTETDKYPEDLEFDKLLEYFKATGKFQHLEYLDEINIPEGGTDKNDHPPITPCIFKNLPPETSKTSNKYKLYELIVKYFFASLHKDYRIKIQEFQSSFGGLEFTLKNSYFEEPNFYQESNNCERVSLDRKIKVKEAILHLEAPKYLTEGELVEKMEEKSIGTDGSINKHIKNVIDRKFVQVNEKTRELIPTRFGLSIYKFIENVNCGLVEPEVRGEIANACRKICEGEDYEEQVDGICYKFMDRFRHLEEELNGDISNVLSDLNPAQKVRNSGPIESFSFA